MNQRTVNKIAKQLNLTPFPWIACGNYVYSNGMANDEGTIFTISDIYIEYHGEQHTEAIASAMNNTFGKGINPVYVEKMRDILSELIEIATDPTHGDLVWRLKVIEMAREAFEKSELKYEKARADTKVSGPARKG
jgi:hypothetical protein